MQLATRQLATPATCHPATCHPGNLPPWLFATQPNMNFQNLKKINFVLVYISFINVKLLLNFLNRMKVIFFYSISNILKADIKDLVLFS